jgi:hypothetical protein
MAFPSGAVPGVDVSHYQKVIDWPTVATGKKHLGSLRPARGDLSLISTLPIIGPQCGEQACCVAPITSFIPPQMPALRPVIS